MFGSQLGRWVSGDLDRPRGGRKDFTRGVGIFFFGKNSCRLIQGWVSVPGFGALKYDVRHTPIVIERIAKEWKLKRT
jgi:hypothetical protein